MSYSATSSGLWNSPVPSGPTMAPPGWTIDPVTKRLLPPGAAPGNNPLAGLGAAALANFTGAAQAPPQPAYNPLSGPNTGSQAAAPAPPVPAQLPGAGPNDPSVGLGAPAPAAPPRPDLAGAVSPPVMPGAALDGGPAVAAGGAAAAPADQGAFPTPGTPGAVSRYTKLLPGIGQGESGAEYRTGTGNTYGFIDPTWQDFLKSPANTGGWTMADKNNQAAQRAAAQWNMGHNDSYLTSALGRAPTDAELSSAWLLGPKGAALFAQNPNGDAFKTYSDATSPGYAEKAFAQNGKLLQQGDTNGQVLGKLAAFYKVGQPSSAGVTNPPDAQTSTTALVNDQNANAQRNGSPDEISDILKKYGIHQPDATDQGLALASGLLSGPTLGAGLGKGLAALNQIRSQQRSVGLEAANLDMANKRLNLYGQNIGSEIGHRGNQDTNAAARVDIAQGNQGIAAGRLQVAQGGLANNVQRVQSQISGTTAGNQVFAKAAADDQKNLLDTVPERAQKMQDIDTMRQQLQQHPEMFGPQILPQITRFAASAGLIPGADTLNTYQKASVQQRNTMLAEISHGHVGAFRSNQEVNNLGGALANAGTDPAAADWILQTSRRLTEADNAWADKINSEADANPAEYSGRKYLTNKSNFEQRYFQENPLPTYTGKPDPVLTAPQAATSGPPPLSSFWSK